MIEYKGYLGEVSFDNEAGVFHGEVIGTSDVITFQALSIAELRTAFRHSIDEYLKFCADQGQPSDLPDEAEAQEQGKVN
jgi:predicted HicB family RNase H-like nuclease